MADLTRMDDGLENSSRAESLSDLISMETKMSELMDEEVSNRRRKAAEATAKIQVNAYKEQLKVLKEIEKLEKKKDEESLKRADKLKKKLQEAAKEQAKLLESQERSDLKKEVSQQGILKVIQNQELKSTEKFDILVSKISDLCKKLDNQIDTIGNYRAKIDTRLTGSGLRYENGIFGPFGSSEGLASRLTGVVGLSPYIKTADVMANLNAAVEKGIAFNVDQRAFLQTISQNIATTFDAFDSTLMQIIRVQQADTTAARLGMEASLNSYLNNMYQNTEYLSGVSDTVTSALYEATSQMRAESSIGFEYQVQKWLGSLYSVGMSNQAVSSIASALGQLGSGNVSSLSGNQGLQNLMVMAASRAGLSYASLLTGGLTEQSTNALLQSMVDYLAEIAGSDNMVVRSQLAAVFGMSVSDIAATANLVRSSADIYKSTLGYQGAMNSLTSMANSMYQRVSMGGMMQNIWDNLQYGMAEGIATNPALYAIWKAANMLDATTGGIALPAISVMGNSVDLETTVADIMRVGAVGTGLLGGIGNLISGIAAGSGGGFSGSGMLRALGIGGGIQTTARGSGLTVLGSGQTVSQSTMVGNSSGSDIQNSITNQAQDQKNEEMVKAKEEDNSVTMDEINEHIISIQSILERVTSGTAYFHVVESPYGAPSIS